MNRDKHKKALLIGSGEDIPETPPFLSSLADTLIISADGGADTALKWGITPAIIVGDLDSIGEEAKNYWKEKNIPFLEFPVAKDKTDIELAVDYALQKGVQEVILTGAWGSRVDHSLGNIGILYSLAQKGVKNTLLTKDNRVSACSNKFAAQVLVGSTISLLPLTDQVTNLTGSGFRFPLERVTLVKGSTLGVSNEAIAKEISLEFDSGILLIVFA